MPRIDAPALDPIAARWRELFLEVVEPRKDAPIFLSGGVDSAAILSAQLALGARPDVYTLRLEGWHSSDLSVARSMAETFDLPFTVVTVPHDEDALVEDIKHLIRLLGTTRKTAIQNGQCVMHLARAARAAGHTEAFIGTGGVVEDCRECQMILHYEGEEAARAFRAKTLFRSDGDEMDGTKAMHTCARAEGIEPIEPLAAQPFADYSLSLDVSEINRGRQKGIALRAFPGFWRSGPWYRRNKSMQVESGIREWHDTLLKSKWNVRGNKRVIGVYNDLAKLA